MNKESLSGLIDKFVLKKIPLQDIKDISNHVRDSDFEDSYRFTESLQKAIEQQGLNEARKRLSTIIEEEKVNEKKVKLFELRNNSIQVAAAIFFICACTIVIRVTTSYNDISKFKKVKIEKYA